MDDVYTRAKYSRYGAKSRKHKRNCDGRFAIKIVRQTVISILLLAAVWFLKGIDSPLTVHVDNGVKWVVEKSVEPQMMYDSIRGLFKRNPSKEDLAGESRHNREQAYDGEAKSGVLSASVELDGSPVFVFPMEGTVITPFGEKKNHDTKTEEFNCGIDIAVNEKAAVKSAADGKVVETGEKSLYGKYIKIDHGSGWKTVYGHCSEILVDEGDSIEQGDVAAYIDVVCGTVESHLHFEIWREAFPVDPMLYLEEEHF